jgi:hypothetical protein
VKNQKLNVVEGSAPSEMEEEPTSNVSVRGAENVGVLATRDSFAATIGKEKLWIMVIHLD